jgi:anti-sigma-K factor RskA
LPPETDIHAEVGGYLLGSLTPLERERFEAHLAGCGRCRDEVRELAGTVEAFPLALEVSDVEVPDDLEAGIVEAVRRDVAAREDGVRSKHAEPLPDRSRGERRGWRMWLAPRRLAAAGAALAVIAVAVVAGTRIAGEDGPPGQPGTLEVAGTMVAPAAGAETGEVRVRMTGIGRLISFRSDELPILPTGEYYELWFVAPGDSPETPNRISAGTFHPNQQGRSRVEFTAAVDPAKYPILSVTAEPGDGNPAATGPEVLRLDSRDAGGS